MPKEQKETKEPVSEKEQVSGETTEKSETSEPIFSPEQESKIQQMLADSMEIAEKRGVEKGRKQMQSEKDKDVKAAQRTTKAYEEALSVYKQNLGELDPEVAAKLHIAELEAKVGAYSAKEEEEKQAKLAQAFEQSFMAEVAEIVKDYGVEPDDKRIDWGMDAPDYLTRLNRIRKSAQTIAKTKAGDEDAKLKERAKDLVAQERKEQGAEYVDTETSAGITSLSGAEKTEQLAKRMRENPTEENKRAFEEQVDKLWDEWLKEKK